MLVSAAREDGSTRCVGVQGFERGDGLEAGAEAHRFAEGFEGGEAFVGQGIGGGLFVAVAAVDSGEAIDEKGVGGDFLDGFGEGFFALVAGDVGEGTVEFGELDGGGIGLEIEGGGTFGGDELAGVKAEGLGGEAVEFFSGEDEAAVGEVVLEPVARGRHRGEPGGAISDEGVDGAVAGEVAGDVTGGGVEDGFGEDEGAGVGGFLEDFGKEATGIIHAAIHEGNDDAEAEFSGLAGGDAFGGDGLKRGGHHEFGDVAGAAEAGGLGENSAEGFGVDGATGVGNGVGAFIAERVFTLLDGEVDFVKAGLIERSGIEFGGGDGTVAVNEERGMIHGLRGGRLENEGGIGSAEAEGIGENGVEFGIAWCADEIELAGGIGLADIEAGGEDAVLESEQADCGFDGSGAAEEVAHCGFGGGDGDVFGVIAGPSGDGVGFGDVVERGAGAVGVEVLHLRGGNVGLPGGGGHGADGGEAFGVGLGEVMEVGGDAVAGDFRDGGGSPGKHGGFGFQNHHGSAFTEGESVAMGVERAGDAGDGEGLEGIETREDELAEGIVSARECEGALTAAEGVKGVADGVGSGGAGVGNDLGVGVEAEGFEGGADLTLDLVVFDTLELARAPDGGGGGGFEELLAEGHGAGGGADDEGGVFWDGREGGVGEGLLCGVEEDAGAAVEAVLLAGGKVGAREGFGDIGNAGGAEALA